MKTTYVCDKKQETRMSIAFIVALVILVAGAITFMNIIA